MKKYQFFIVLLLLVSILTGSVYAVYINSHQALKRLPSNRDIPFTAVYNGFDDYTGCASNGEIYVAVGNGGHAAISGDLQNWEKIRRFTYENLIYVAFTGEKFVAFDDRLKYSSSAPKDNKMGVYVSENGIDWTEELIDIPKDVTRWYDLSFTEDEFVFVDADNSFYYATRDFNEWTRIPFLRETTNMHTHLSIRKLNGQYVLLGNSPDWPQTMKIYAFSQGNEWAELSSIPGNMELARDLILYKGSYYFFNSVPTLQIYTSKDMKSWTKSDIAVDAYPGGRIAALRALPVNGKIHLIYSVENNFAGFSDRYKTVELVSDNGTVWEKTSLDIPVRNDILVSEFSVLNDREIISLGSGSCLFSRDDNEWKRLNMPSYSTGSKNVYYGNEFTVFQEVLHNYISPDVQATKITTAITKDGKNMVNVEAPAISQWTGREFIAQGRATSDFKNWRDVKVPEELSQFKDSTYYTWADGFYLAQVRVYYSNDRERLLEDELLRQAGYDRTVYILDGKFNLIGKHKFESIIRGIDHVNGSYFVQLEDGSVFRSDNAAEWKESSLEELLEQSIHNGSKSYLRNDAEDSSITGVSISSDKHNWRSVVLDGKPLNSCTLAGKYYVAQCGDSIYVSRDGCYWLRIAVPYKGENRLSIFSTTNSLLLAGSNWLFYYPIEALSSALDEPALLKEIE